MSSFLQSPTYVSGNLSGKHRLPVSPVRFLLRRRRSLSFCSQEKAFRSIDHFPFSSCAFPLLGRSPLPPSGAASFQIIICQTLPFPPPRSLRSLPPQNQAFPPLPCHESSGGPSLSFRLFGPFLRDLALSIISTRAEISSPPFSKCCPILCTFGIPSFSTITSFVSFLVQSIGAVRYSPCVLL